MPRRVELDRLTREIQAVGQELRETSATASGRQQQRLVSVGRYVERAWQDIRENVHPPIEPVVMKAIIGLLAEMAGVLSVYTASSAPQGKISLTGVTDKAYELIDDIHEYLTIAGHFYHREVQEARRHRRTDEMGQEAKFVSREARELKKAVLEYLGAVRGVLASLDG